MSCVSLSRQALCLTRFHTFIMFLAVPRLSSPPLLILLLTLSLSWGWDGGEISVQERVCCRGLIFSSAVSPALFLSRLMTGASSPALTPGHHCLSFNNIEVNSDSKGLPPGFTLFYMLECSLALVCKQSVHGESSGVERAGFH